MSYVNATRAERLRMALEVRGHPQWFGPLIDIALGIDVPAGCRAAWVIEFVCRQELQALYPHLAAFTVGLSKLRHDSSIRSMAKCCELLAVAWAGPGDPRPPLSEGQKEHMVSSCFDWLISPQKAAAQAYAMQTLYLLGPEEPWIHEELKGVLHRGYPLGTAGYQARSRRILKLLEKPPY